MRKNSMMSYYTRARKSVFSIKKAARTGMVGFSCVDDLTMT